VKQVHAALAVCCVAVLAYTACGAAQTATEFFPLAVGNWWAYTGEGVEFRMTVQDVVEGQFLIVSEVNGFPVQREYYAPEGEDVIALRREIPAGSFDLDPPQVFLRAPMAPGNRWSWEGSVAGQRMRMTFTIMEPETVETPAGTFEALPLVVTGSSDGEVLRLVRWFVAGVGMVRERAQVTEGSQSFLVDMRLVAYNVE